MNLTQEECRELYLKALKEQRGFVPYETKVVKVGSLLEFTQEVIKVQEEQK